GADELFSVGVDQEFVRIETMSCIRLVGSVHPETVDGSGVGVRHITMPDLVGVFGQLDALELGVAVVVEQTHLNPGRMRGADGVIPSETIPCGAERKRVSLADRYSSHLF